MRPDAGKTGRDKTYIPDYLNSSTNKTHIPDYFHSSNNKEADKRMNKAIIYRIYNEFNNLFCGIGCFEGIFFASKRDQPPVSGTTKKGSLCTAKDTERRGRITRVAENYSSVRCWQNITAMQQFCFGTQG